MRRTVKLKIVYDTEQATKGGIIHVISEIGAVCEVDEIK